LKSRKGMAPTQRGDSAINRRLAILTGDSPIPQLCYPSGNAEEPVPSH